MNDITRQLLFLVDFSSSPIHNLLPDPSMKLKPLFLCIAPDAIETPTTWPLLEVSHFVYGSDAYVQ